MGARQPSGFGGWPMENVSENLKSDIEAKHAFKELLQREGYSDVRIGASPTDIAAKKNDVCWLFEVKFTRAETRCFGAATLTEWAAAAEDPDHFQFVIAYKKGENWLFDRYGPDEFMAFSSVPPFKIYFNVPIGKKPLEISKRLSKRIYLTKSRLKLLSRQFDELRALEN
jgi:hypothetical protein